MRLALLAAALFAFAAPGLAHAEKLKLEIKVVAASNDGASVDPKLKHMAGDFHQFKSFKLMSESSPVLSPKQSTTVSLPNGKSATFTFKGAQAKTINLHVSIPGVADLDLAPADRRVAYQGVGPVKPGGKDSQLFVAYTPVLQQ